MFFKILTVLNTLVIIGYVLKKTYFRRNCFVFPWAYIKDGDLWVGYRTVNGSSDYRSFKSLFKK